MLKRLKVAPLSSSFLLTSILGFIVSAMYVYKVDRSFGFAFMFIFAVMFIASLISMAQAPVEAEIALDHHVRKSGRKPSK
jgi:hypothetical protein